MQGSFILLDRNYRRISSVNEVEVIPPTMNYNSFKYKQTVEHLATPH